jgi:pyridoxamine 5'-phosphate oxidase
MDTEPITLFRTLYEQYQRTQAEVPSAVTVATATPEGKPSARIVLLKGFDENGFVFYSNLGSRKARELKLNPYAALCFYWEPIGCQVRIEGSVAQVAEDEADTYFHSRPEGSQVGAWASRQSEILPSREVLEARVKSIQKKYAGQKVPRPPFWSGYRVVPSLFEFWQRRPDRLHERICFTKTEDGWHRELLYP